MAARLLELDPATWVSHSLHAPDRDWVETNCYIDVWVDTVQALRPELDSINDRGTARAAVQATFGLLNSTPHSARIKPTEMRALLIEMAHRSLIGPGATRGALD